MGQNKKEFKEIVLAKLAKGLDEVIEQTGISDTSMRNYCIRYHYKERAKQLKEDGQTEQGDVKLWSIVSTLASEYDISHPQVQNIVYNNE
jgi:hypothetical protein